MRRQRNRPSGCRPAIGRTGSIQEWLDAAGAVVATVEADGKGTFGQLVSNTTVTAGTAVMQSTPFGVAVLAKTNSPTPKEYDTFVGGNFKANANYTGRDNTAIGWVNLETLTSGRHNTLVGTRWSPRLSGAASYNVFIGTGGSSTSAADGSYRTAVGYLSEATADYDVALGASATCDSTGRSGPIIQLGENATKYSKIGVGDDRLIPVTELKALVASAADWSAFQTAIAAL